jgi:hypothetical protein
VFTHDGVILPLDHFFGHGAGVLLGHIEETCASSAVQADFDCGWLRHKSRPERDVIRRRAITNRSGSSQVSGSAIVRRNPC